MEKHAKRIDGHFNGLDHQIAAYRPLTALAVIDNLHMRLYRSRC